MKQGRIFYQGKVDDIVSYFQQLGRPCPENYNPSDFIMNLCQTETKEELFAAVPAKFQADNNETGDILIHPLALQCKVSCA